jgi:hypothetical protein
MKLSEREELIWLAAFFEAEGTVHIIRNRAPAMSSGYQYQVRITLGQCHKAPVLRYQRAFGGTISKRVPKNPKHNISFHWQCSSRQAVAALSAMLPFLEMKKEQAELAIEFQSLRKRGSPQRNASGKCTYRAQGSGIRHTR